MTEQEFRAGITRARSVNRSRDQAERNSGLLAQSDDAPVGQLRTILLALECGIKHRDIDSLAEAYAMTEDLAALMEGVPKPPCGADAGPGEDYQVVQEAIQAMRQVGEMEVTQDGMLTLNRQQRRAQQRKKQQ